MELIRVSPETARFCWGDTDSDSLRAYVKAKWGKPNAEHDRMLAAAVHLLKERGDWTTQDEIGTIPKPIRRPPGMRSIGGGVPLAATIPIVGDDGAARAIADLAADAAAAFKQGYARFPLIVSDLRLDRPNLLVPVPVKGSVAVLEGAVDCPAPGPGRANVAIIETDGGFALALGWEERLDNNGPWEPVAEFAGGTIEQAVERAVTELTECDCRLADLVKHIAAMKAAESAAPANEAATAAQDTPEHGEEDGEAAPTPEEEAALQRALADRNACAAAWRRRLGLEDQDEAAP